MTIEERRVRIERSIVIADMEAKQVRTGFYMELEALQKECGKKGHGSTLKDAESEWCNDCGEKI